MQSFHQLDDVQVIHNKFFTFLKVDVLLQLDVFLQVLPLSEANKPVKVLQSIPETVLECLLVDHSHEQGFEFLKRQFVANRLLFSIFENLLHSL